MRKIRCRKCGSIGYSASSDAICECGSRCQEIVKISHGTRATLLREESYLKNKRSIRGVVTTILRTLL